MKLTGIKSKDINSITVFDLIDEIETDSFTKRWDSIIKGMDYSGVLKIRSKTGEEKWIHGVFKGVNDLHNQIERMLFTGNIRRMTPGFSCIIPENLLQITVPGISRDRTSCFWHLC